VPLTAAALLMTCIGAPIAGAQTVAPPAITVGTLADAPSWIRPAEVARFALSRAIASGDGRIAVLVGDTDWTGLTDTTGTVLALRPAGVGFPPGEHVVSVYLVGPANQWSAVGQTTLRVLTAGGFEKAVTTPAVDVGLTGQAALHREPPQPPTERDTYQDLSVRAGIATTHAKNGWTTTSQAQVVGVSEQSQALRYATAQDEAPLVDLGSYQVGLRNHTLSLSAGHGSFGSHRMLLDMFASRGVSGTVRLGPVVDVSLAAVNGSTIVGYDNVLGLADDDHRIVNATVGLEVLPARRGALRVAASLVDGAVTPATNVNQGAIRDPEESHGLGVQVQATDVRARFRLDAGVARSRFVNPADPTSPPSLVIVPVRESTRDARYVDVSYALLQGAKLGDAALANLTAAFRHSRVDPLYRTVALPVRADLYQNAVDVTAGLGAFTSQFTYDVSRDNLAAIASVLTTRSRQILWSSALPLQTFAGTSPGAAAWPTLSYSLSRVHQAGDGLPERGLFDSISQVPDQVSLNQTLGVTWQGAVWRGGYSWNRSHQDNRQVGRERADLLNVVHTISVGAMAATTLDAGVEFAFENADNRELTRTDRTRRVSVTAAWRPAARTNVAAVLTRNLLQDEPRTSERRTTDATVAFTQGVSFRRGRPDGPGAQFFVRYVNQTVYGLVFALPAPDQTRFWTLNTGLTFRVF
jgi:hypothetical protein